MLKILYAGSPEDSALTLKSLLEKSKDLSNGFEIVGVLTNPPTAKGRHSELVPTPVAQVAAQWNNSTGSTIKIFEPEHLDSTCRQSVESTGAELLLCFAYGHIFGPKFMALFKFGGMNMHPSLLPKYRGCTPVNAAILAEDDVTGISIQTISPKCDEGDLFFQNKINLNKTETAQSLLTYCAQNCVEPIVESLKFISQNQKLPPLTKQTGDSSYCSMIKKEDGKINWANDVHKIDAQNRAYYPWPGTFTTFNGISLKIIKGKIFEGELKDSVTAENAKPGTVLEFNKQNGILIKCGSGIYCATELQLQAKKAMDYKSFMNGTRNFVGALLE